MKESTVAHITVQAEVLQALELLLNKMFHRSP